MCIAVLLLGWSDRFPVVIAHNREEDPFRVTSALGVHFGNILCSVDMRSGGVAAVGVNVDTKEFAVLTNCRFKSNSIKTGSLSRGILILELLKHNISTLSSDDFQGGFHLYSGSLVDTQRPVECFSNLPGLSLRSRSIQAPAIEVRLNDHPLSEIDFKIKTDYLINKFNLIKSKISLCSSVEALRDLIAQVLSSHESIVSDAQSGFEWSPLPATVESEIQKKIFISKLRINSTTFYATISQTIIISDFELKLINYFNRNPINDTFPDYWDQRSIPFQ